MKSSIVVPERKGKMMELEATLNTHTNIIAVNKLDWSNHEIHACTDHATAITTKKAKRGILTKFDAQEIKGDILIEWIIEKEVNISHFSIERSLDGINFEPIGYEVGLGPSEKTQHYIYRDKNPPEGSVFYRLIQFNVEEILMVTNPIHIKIKRYTILKISNEVDNEEKITQGPNGTNQEIELILKNNYRDIILSTTTHIVTNQEIELYLPDISAGMYILYITRREDTKKIMMVKN